MKLAVMQPYFFPYLGYFQLIHSVEKFLFFDETQYQRKSWMNRNRLLNTETNKPFYIRPQVKKPDYKDLLVDVSIFKNDEWRKKILAQLDFYKKKAPFYDEVYPLIEEILFYNTVSLADFNSHSIIQIARWLDINVVFDQYSNYKWDFERKPNKGEWGLEIASNLNASHYINAPGGEGFIMPGDFKAKKIHLGFIQPNCKGYFQGSNNFVPNLSIIDVLLFKGLSGTKELLVNYSVKWKN